MSAVSSTGRGASGPDAARATEPAALSLRHIDKHFGERAVLADIGFDVAVGEVVAVVGASGCGKSTLLNIISGLLRADAGSVTYEGVAARDFTGWQSLAYMFQEDRLLPWRTLAQNVAFGLEARDVPGPARRERVRDAVALVGLEAAADRYPHELSGGMRSRAALARSLVTRPSVLLMDEPFSKLDPATRAHMHDEVLRIKALMGMTIVFVTHDIEEAVVLADRVVLLRPNPGRIGEIVPVTLPRPRVGTDQPVAEAVRQLRLKI